ncbi:single-stranded DNA-binding protein [Pseudomonas aeruginosa]|uniref:single-stranded DNA-binding protein n=1 Tax=Pseudomonas aeruginosa TaxID=287 RepID=UPI000F7E2572|nr:single-stranded DNA-binding protein [Pseudomonas aeruginosa]RTB44088.1 single-stranded DNA-binding protein [Pseudomonas aeruginosa]
MSTHFINEGNIGAVPEFHEYPNGNEEPRRVLRLSVYFDNPVPAKGGGFEDKGGFWRPVDWWHRDAEHFATLFQRGMRVMVQGREERDDWVDDDNNQRTTYRINARSVAILPYRVEVVTVSPKQNEGSESHPE